MKWAFDGRFRHVIGHEVSLSAVMSLAESATRGAGVSSLALKRQ